MTVQQCLRRKLIQKTIILCCIAVILGFLCIWSAYNSIIPLHNNNIVIYILVSIGISLAVLAFIAYKIRFFHILFGREFTGTVIFAEVSAYNTRSNDSMRSINRFIVVVKLDNSDKEIKLVFSTNKISSKVYVEGDRVHRIKGTRDPINLTREEEQHICPICGRNSCYEDECPDCKIKY